MNRRDLFIVVADLDAENTVRTLLSDRQEALGVQINFNPDSPPQGDMLRYVGRDSGCYKDATDVLRPPQVTHDHAILLFDRHGSGAEQQDAGAIEAAVEQRLVNSGWDSDRIAVVVIDPELEAWVWAGSRHVEDALGWSDDRGGLRPFLTAAGLWSDDARKPDDPKLAMQKALAEKSRPAGARLFSDLAGRAGLARCSDRAFRKFTDTLRRWFPADRQSGGSAGA